MHKFAQLGGVASLTDMLMVTQVAVAGLLSLWFHFVDGAESHRSRSGGRCMLSGIRCRRAACRGVFVLQPCECRKNGKTLRACAWPRPDLLSLSPTGGLALSPVLPWLNSTLLTGRWRVSGLLGRDSHVTERSDDCARGSTKPALLHSCS